MRIVHVIKTLDPSIGGPPIVAERLAAAQAGLGHTVSIASYTPAEPEAVRASLEGVPGMSSVELADLGSASGAEGVFARSARRRFTTLLGEADVAHLHGVWNPVVRAAAGVASATGTPYVVTPHGVLDPWSLAQRRLKKMLALRFLYGRMLRESAFLHVLNEDERRLIEPLGLGARMEVVPNGIFAEEVDPLPPAGTFRASRPELGDAPYILFLSRLHYKKGLDHLAGAFASIAGEFLAHRLVVAGPDDGALEDFERRIREAGLADRAHVVGPIYGSDKLAAMVDAACFCLPSRQEGFSIAIIEALASATPVVITEGCHFPEVGEAGAGEVVATETDAVAGGLRRVLSDPAGAREMGAAGRALVLERYTWPAIAERMVSLYARASA